MAEPLKPTGFWSYTSSDDSRSGGRLSQLRQSLANQLQLVVGRPKVHIWQDAHAIPHGTDWLREIHKALAESSFFIPIVTPAFLGSEMCCQEVMRFREREQELGREDLIFPFRYVDVSDIEPDEVHDPAVLTLLNSRQWIDFTGLRLRPPNAEDVETTLATLAVSIRATLRRRAAAVVVSAPPPPEPAPVADAAIRQRLTPASAWASTAWGALTTDPILQEGPGPEMVLIPAGAFQMGAPEAESKREDTLDSDKAARPLHRVSIARPFWLGRFPVTVGEYAVFAEETGRDGDRWSRVRFPQDDRHPVVNVSHEDAEAYMAWLSAKTGQTYRLPSEAEWEYAARAGTTTARYWGDAAGKPGENGHWETSIGTCRVDGFKANGFGLHDMLGNVWEWTADAWHDSYDGAPSDGAAWTTAGAASRVLRGGSWFGDARSARSASRDFHDPSARYGNFGFRCARVQS